MYNLPDWKERPAVLAFAVTVLLFAFSYLVWGYYTDTYQSMLDFVYSGDFTGFMPIEESGFPEYMGGISNVLPALNTWMPMRWLAILLFSILFLSLWAIYYLVLKEMKDAPVISVGVVVLLSSVFFMESVALYHMVRVAMFAGIAGMVALFADHLQEEPLLSRKRLLYILLFAVGCWIRFNVLLFVLAFAVLVFLVHKRSLKQLFPYLTVFIFFSIYNSTFLHPSRMDTLHFYFTYDAEFKLLFTGEQLPNVVLQDRLDSVKFAAMRNEFSESL